MANNPIFSYTNRDYERSRKEGLSQIPVLSKGKWTDLNPTDPGIIILDYVHALVDMIQYYQDHQALESFLSTAKERESLFRLAKQLSYSIRSAKGAVCDVNFMIPLTEDDKYPMYSVPIKIPKYTELKTTSGIPYLTSEDTYLPKESREVLVPCVQGRISTVEYTGTGVSRYSIDVVGAENQGMTIADSNIDTDFVRVADSLGNIWKRVDYIYLAGKDEKAYEIELNPDNSVTIKFGDGERGYIPTIEDKLTISYVTSLAEEGIVEAEGITTLISTVYDTYGNIVPFEVSNPKASIGGTTAQSSQEIKDLAPGAIKAQDRAVTLQDFENLAKLVAGVSDARAYDINLLENMDYHRVKVLIIPDDVDGDNEALVKRVHNYLSSRVIPPTTIEVTTPARVETPKLSVSVKKVARIPKDEAEYAVRKAIKDYFDARINQVGAPFIPSDLSSVLSSLPEVQYVISMTPSKILDSSNSTIGALSIYYPIVDKVEIVE